MNVKADTIARTICLALALINQLLSVTGHAVLPIEDAEIEILVSTVISIVASIVAWWYNNSFTKAAIIGDNVMHDIKSGGGIVEE